MNLRGLEKFVADWWKAKAIAEGFMWKGRPSVGRLMKAVTLGEYRLVKNTVDS